MTASAFCALVLLHHLALGLVDLRGRSCEMGNLNGIVRQIRPKWSATASVSIYCYGDEDYPLDMMVNRSVACTVKDNTWMPDYIPDCNSVYSPPTELVRPDNVSIGLFIHIGDRCDGLRLASIHSKTTLILVTGKRVDLSKVCETSEELRHCQIEDVVMFCNSTRSNWPPLPAPFDETPDSLANKLYLRVTTPYSDMLGEEVTVEKSAHVLGAVLRHLSLPPKTDFRYVVGANCLAGSTYVLDAARGMVCRGCSKGHYLSGEDKQCVRCPPGHYSDRALSERCDQCPDGDEPAKLSPYDRLMGVDECAYENVTRANSVFDSVHTMGLSETSLATIIVCTTLFLLVSATILSVVAQMIVHKKSHADGVKSQPPSPTDACFADTPSRTSQDTGSGRWSASNESRYMTSVMAVTHGIDNGDEMPLNMI
ncbi:hypothetical protein Btru_055935 [Bulinus truncatus]|nr:hypothetical protein Btru_055935 [Bulinus truncatus]